jgi:hypothetical protein
LPAGAWRLTIPIQAHMHVVGSWDPYTAESGVWVLIAGMQAGGWVNANQMGDRRWFSHVVEFNLPAGGEVEVLIRVKSKHQAPKDFFVDATRLQPIATVSGGYHRQLSPGEALWLMRPLWRIPEDELVTP